MPIQKVNLSNVKNLFRPENVAQVIVDTDARGTPHMDRFYPESARESWDQVIVPIEKLTDVTQAVPVVSRGAPGISIAGTQEDLTYIEPRPVRTKEAVGASEYNNARERGRQSLTDWANRQIRRHLETHRKTSDSLAAESLDGKIEFPLFNELGQKVDTYTVDFGTSELKSFTVSADWTADATALSTIHGDLQDMRRLLRNDGKQATDILVGAGVFNSLLDKIIAIGNDQRFTARLREDGAIQLGAFVVEEWDWEYYNPDTDAYTAEIGTNDLMMYDSGADWTFLRVRLDNFKMLEAFGAQALRRTPLGIVAEFSKSGDSLDIFANSKPFPIPPVRSILRTDVTVI